MGRDTFHLARLLRAPSSLPLNISRDGHDFIQFLMRASFSARAADLERENEDREWWGRKAGEREGSILRSYTQHTLVIPLNWHRFRRGRDLKIIFGSSNKMLKPFIHPASCWWHLVSALMGQHCILCRVACTRLHPRTTTVLPGLGAAASNSYRRPS